MNEQPTIFVVDDDDAIRKGLSLSLKERGFHVESFASAEDFLEAPQPDQPACLILDVRMPRLTGLDLQDELLERGIKLPIIFITGHGDIPMTVRAMRKGAIDFLEKPYELTVLLKRINEAFTASRTMRSLDAEVEAMRTRFARTTKREREVMELLVQGAANASNQLIAEQLGISRRTVETYRARLMEKMQARSLPDLVDMAKKCGVYHS